VLLYKFVHSV